MSRTLSKAQFSAGTTVDGNRIDRQLNDAFARLNSLPVSDCKFRQVPQRLVAGYSPWDGSLDTDYDVGATWEEKRVSLPFLRHANDALDFSQENPIRFKGLTSPGVDAANITEYWLVHTIKMANSKPSILDAVNAFLTVDDAVAAYYQNGFHWVAPKGSQDAGNFVKDIHLIVDVLSPFDPTTVQASAVAYHRYNFWANSQLFTIATVAAGYPELLGEFPTGFPSGLAITARNLGISLPAGCSVRFALAVPLYVDNSPAAQYSEWGGNPVNQQSYSLGCSTYEEIR